ncbi:alpha/beta hydrolase [Mucilaginibacter terrigena]|uniref:Alpha/beta hydrolase n=1 Tax=Mucilaginibacter terrigena TaxID=2492395 RepID=A0A4Q5LSF3_9SPHI|nr:alpha/beta hydrolase [Mucilaginibacter terrigena]RYU92309.1 alpha/beta hydrolase [Mucilaginibacter terrigena]
MRKVYFISGLGADSRIFKYILLPDGYEKIPTHIIVPNKKDTLSNYAEKIVLQYNISNCDIVWGDSLGGMIAVEIAKQVRLDMVLLTSTIKTDSEAPWYFKIFRKLPVYELTPAKLITKLGAFVKPIMRGLASEDAETIKSMLKNSTPEFLKWGAQAALNWRNDKIPDNCYHIIGDKDLVFPYKNIKNPTAVIKGGTHIMVFDKAAEINSLLADILK